ncbi:hypothetical protein [Actinomycetospora lemnae]|uniref:Uncharacterized protein n=1 Tax=Actinomycetospora lemnae TaxID=3019891 RepID=A0ABT5SZ93_9PSEU|nr:hypothetical protein [Actinomycetospora sp. DW7H6]MDD7967038.1 hypothetical protein [Actinomycetospora sp. DW7H6]
MNVKRLLVALATAITTLTLLSVVVALVRPAPSGLWAYVDVLEPYNLPTWLAATVLLATVLACLANAVVAATRGRFGSRCWVAAGAAAAVASLCVATGLHTRIDGLARQAVGSNPLTTDWLVPAVVAGLLLATPFALLARRLRDGRRLVAALVTFGVGALGGELVVRALGDGGRVLAAVAEGVQGLGAAGLLAVVVTALHAARGETAVHLVSDLPDAAPRDLPTVPRRARAWVLLLVVTPGLAAMSLLLTLAVPAPGPKLAQWVGYLDVDGEGNVPTWWSVGLLVTAAAAHLVAGLVGRATGARGAAGWLVTAAILAGMSLDDMTSIHERVGDLVRPEGAAAADDPGRNFSFYWVVPGAAVALVIAVAVGLLALRLRGRPRWLLVVGLGVLFSFALGLEGVQGVVLAQGTGGRVAEVLAYHLEELGENLGALLLLGAATSALALRRSDDGRDGGLDVRYAGTGHPEDGDALFEAEEDEARLAASPTEAIPVVTHRTG